jgi:hypothetical protein
MHNYIRARFSQSHGNTGAQTLLCTGYERIFPS